MHLFKVLVRDKFSICLHLAHSSGTTYEKEESKARK
jgi:hypothetical protein